MTAARNDFEAQAPGNRGGFEKSHFDAISQLIGLAAALAAQGMCRLIKDEILAAQ
jgi:hypothetical protein